MNDHDKLSRRERALEAELERRGQNSATERQVRLALGRGDKRSAPKYKPEEEWTTTDRQLFAARDIRPLAD